MNRSIKYLFFWVIFLCCGISASHARELNSWILQGIRDDESILRDAISKSNGVSLEMLEHSNSYIPFFLELPTGVSGLIGVELSEFKDFSTAYTSPFLNGGYLYRISFDEAPSLYALSSGDWNGDEWYSPEIDSKFAIEPTRVWEGRLSDGCSYVAAVFGVEPRIVVYDIEGKEIKRIALNISSSDINVDIEKAIAPFSDGRPPRVEMVGLVEFLNVKPVPWRELDLNSSDYNLRNQYTRDAERGVVDAASKITRAEIIKKLSPKLEVATPVSDPDQLSNKVVTRNPNSTNNSPSRLSLPSVIAWIGMGLLFCLLGTLWIIRTRKNVH